MGVSPTGTLSQCQTMQRAIVRRPAHIFIFLLHPVCRKKCFYCIAGFPEELSTAGILIRVHHITAGYNVFPVTVMLPMTVGNFT